MTTSDLASTCITRRHVCTALKSAASNCASTCSVECNDAFCNDDFTVQRATASRGEWTSNLALKLAAHLKKSPSEVARELMEALNQAHYVALNYDNSHAQVFSQHWRVEEARGFLNFRLDEKYLNAQLNAAQQQGERYGRTQVLAGDRINVEWVSADPTGPLPAHAARIALAGESLCRILESAGATVTREYFLNDDETSSKLRLIGHSAYVWYRSAFDSGAAREAETSGEILGDEWVRSVAREAVRQDGNKWLLAPQSEAQAHFAHLAREAAVQAQHEALEKLGVRFDVWSSESDLLAQGRIQAVLDKLRARGHAYDRDGTLWLASTSMGDEADRPLTRRGRPTYLATDIAYHEFKFQRGFGRLINIWNSQHSAYVTRTRAALRAMGRDADALDVLVCEGVRARRDGIAISAQGAKVTLDQLLQEFSLPALQYFLIAPNWSDIAVIDSETAGRDDETNPAYALQLLPSRLTTSIGELEVKTDPALLREDYAGWTASESELRRLVALWPDEMESAAQNLEPQRIARFALELAQAAREDLSQTRASETNKRDDETLSARLQLLRAALVVANQALKLLGIAARSEF